MIDTPEIEDFKLTCTPFTVVAVTILALPDIAIVFVLLTVKVPPPSPVNDIVWKLALNTPVIWSSTYFLGVASLLSVGAVNGKLVIGFPLTSIDVTGSKINLADEESV